MKKITTIVLFFTFCCVGTTGYAQYSKGDLTANAGISFGLIGYGFGYGSSSIGFPAISANVEYSLDDRFAFGPYLGYFARTYKAASYKNGFSVVSFGGRGTFHATSSLNDWLSLSIDEDKWDLYGTLILGYEVYSWNYDSAWGDNDLYDSSSGGVVFGPVVGARYHFNNKIGAYFEGGRGAFGWGTLGVSAKF